MAGFRATAALTSLPPIRDYVLGQAKDAGIPITLEPKLDLVLEEVLVNVASHAYNGQSGDVEVECASHADSFCCTVRDWGNAFNPLSEAPVPDTESGIDERAVGGLGLMFLTTMSDDCSYTRADDANELTFCFSF